MARIKVGHGDGEIVSSSPQLFLSEELIIEVLTRAHAKTLFRSKGVCKSWRNWISDQAFINRFITRSKSLPPCITGLFCRVGNIFESDGGNAHFFDTSNCNDGFLVIDNTLSFLTSVNGPIIIVDSDNGLLLGAAKPNGVGSLKPIRYFVCNPVTKQWILLPKPRHCDYNASALLYSYNMGEPCLERTEFMVYSFLKKRSQMLHVEIYCSKTGKWKEPKIYHYVWFLKEFTSITLFNGSAYWLQEDGKVAVCDLEKEILRFIELPQRDMLGRWALHLGVSDRSLYYTERSTTCFYVWILVDGVEFHLHQTIQIEKLTTGKNTSFGNGSGSSKLRFKLLGFHPAEYKLVLVGLNECKAALYLIDQTASQCINNLRPSVFCNCHLKIIPYSLPAWPTCIPCVKNS